MNNSLQKEYELISNFIIEAEDDPNLHKQILTELTDALIDIVERYGCYCGGGFQLKQYNEVSDVQPD